MPRDERAGPIARAIIALEFDEDVGQRPGRADRLDRIGDASLGRLCVRCLHAERAVGRNRLLIEAGATPVATAGDPKRLIATLKDPTGREFDQLALTLT